MLEKEPEGKKRNRESRRIKRERMSAENQKKRSREITLSPTRMRGSYESRGGRNPDYCSPDYNITRTDRPACITGDPAEIASLCTDFQRYKFSKVILFVPFRYFVSFKT